MVTLKPLVHLGDLRTSVELGGVDNGKRGDNKVPAQNSGSNEQATRTKGREAAYSLWW